MEHLMEEGIHMAQNGYGCNVDAPSNVKFIRSKFKECSECLIASKVSSDTEVQSAAGGAIGIVRFKKTEIVERSSRSSVGKLGKSAFGFTRFLLYWLDLCANES